MKCPECGAEMKAGGVCKTLVGCGKFPPGHDHDDNCRSRVYICPNNHKLWLSRRNRCPAPGCDWKGKDECFCHSGRKVDEWPDAQPAGLHFDRVVTPAFRRDVDELREYDAKLRTVLEKSGTDEPRNSEAKAADLLSGFVVHESLSDDRSRVKPEALAKIKFIKHSHAGKLQCPDCGNVSWFRSDFTYMIGQSVLGVRCSKCGQNAGQTVVELADPDPFKEP